jgi:type VI secretion system secreted protein Hcp
MSRRRFVEMTVGAAGAALGTWLWVPVLGHAQPTPPRVPAPFGATPTPVPLVKPITLQAPGGTGVAFFLEFPAPSEGGLSQISLTGESTDAAHPNTIELLSAELGIRNRTTIGSSQGGAGAARAEFEALRVLKSVDLASPHLLLAAGEGVHFPQMNLYVRRPGSDDTVPLYQFKLVYVTRSVIAADGTVEQPQETVDFVFGAMQISATSQPVDVAAWSAVLNQPIFDVGP